MRKARPWDRTPADDFAIGSIRALMRGDASEGQQKKACDFILRDICGMSDLAYFPDSTRDTDFALGKRFVAMELVRLTKPDATRRGGGPPK